MARTIPHPRATHALPRARQAWTADPNQHALTIKRIQELKPRPTRYIVWDSELPAFGVRVSPAGRKTYRLGYRLPSGRYRWANLGRVEAVTLDQARRKAKRYLGLVADGKDPLSVKDAARGAILTRDVAEQFLEQHADVHLKPATQRNYRHHIAQHIGPVLGSVPISDLTSADAAKLQHRLRGTKMQANRVLATLSSLCTWCERHGYRDVGSNPCQRLVSFRETHRERYLSPEELKRLGAALRVGARYGRLSPSSVAIVKLLVFIGARVMEICALRWDEVDLVTGQIRKPRKRGAKPIYLNPPAVQVLADWPRFEGSPFVFPGTGRKTKGAHRVIPAKAWKWICRRARLKNARIHDLRHSFASVTISQGRTLAVVGALLGHTQAQTTQRYSHLMDDPLRAASKATGDTLSAALGRRQR
ncbi:MAG: tyrosine-type recombinase/integrase [Luteitalea sp.]|nr:tyrosine-type recombinase/integrase [Luteitalea sp.]